MIRNACCSEHQTLFALAGDLGRKLNLVSPMPTCDQPAQNGSNLENKQQQLSAAWSYPISGTPLDSQTTNIPKAVDVNYKSTPWIHPGRPMTIFRATYAQMTNHNYMNSYLVCLDQVGYVLLHVPLDVYSQSFKWKPVHSCTRDNCTRSHPTMFTVGNTIPTKTGHL